MKKCTLLILVICLTVYSLTYSVSAQSSNEMVFYFDNNKEVIISGSNEIISNEKMEMIANNILQEHLGNSGIALASEFPLMCRLFGHQIENTSATIIDHNYYSTSPFCRESVYDVEICARDNCPYHVTVIREVQRTSECHG